MSVESTAIEPQNLSPIKSYTSESQKLEQLANDIITARNFHISPEFLQELTKTFKDKRLDARTFSHQSLRSLLENNKELREFLGRQHEQFFELEQSIDNLHGSESDLNHRAKKLLTICILTLVAAVFCGISLAICSSPLIFLMCTTAVVTALALAYIHGGIFICSEYDRLNNAIASLQKEQNALSVVKSEGKTLSVDELNNIGSQPQDKNYFYKGGVEEAFSSNRQTFYQPVVPKSNVAAIGTQPTLTSQPASI